MGAFDTVFQDALDVAKHPKACADGISPEHFVNLMADEEVVRKLKEDMEKDGLYAEYLINAGTQGFIFKLKGSKHGVIRIDPNMRTEPFDDPSILKPVIRKKYGEDDNAYYVSVLPFAANAGDGTIEDTLHMLAKLKAGGKMGYKDVGGKQVYFSHFLDVSPAQLSNLTDGNGELLCDHNGRHISFIHDLNATTNDPDKLTKGFGTPEKYIDSHLLQLRETLKNLDPADEEQQQIIKGYRKRSAMGQKIKDDTNFLKYLIEKFENPSAITKEDLAAPLQQASVLESLRNELEKMPLADELKEQLKSRRTWDTSPVRADPVMPADSNVLGDPSSWRDNMRKRGIGPDAMERGPLDPPYRF